ncbi:MAG: T9SS type A sorting domain-containing protein [Bacteroidetes bacterium]|nr:T9SS type A sorting domain-containing protein [Bacteroidota bacterium]
MKHLIFILVLLCSAICKAQLPLEHSFSARNSYPQVIVFSSNGKKILSNDTSSNQVKLYNMDYSLWKSISVPVPANYKLNSTFLITDNLFNNDNSVELIASCYYYDQAANTVTYSLRLINETGNIIQDFGNNNYASVLKDDNGIYKLIVSNYQSHPNGAAPTIDSKFYTLPGSTPCDACGNGLGVKPTNNSSNQSYISAATPNPSTGNTMIMYNLGPGLREAEIQLFNTNGQIINRYSISQPSGNINVLTSDLAPGTYFYSLRTESELTPAQKITVIR